MRKRCLARTLADKSPKYRFSGVIRRQCHAGKFRFFAKERSGGFLRRQRPHHIGMAEAPNNSMRSRK